LSSLFKDTSITFIPYIRERKNMIPKIVTLALIAISINVYGMKIELANHREGGFITPELKEALDHLDAKEIEKILPDIKGVITSGTFRELHALVDAAEKVNTKNRLPKLTFVNAISTALASTTGAFGGFLYYLSLRAQDPTLLKNLYYYCGILPTVPAASTAVVSYLALLYYRYYVSQSLNAHRLIDEDTIRRQLPS
jgi:hypothetical protein